LTTPRRSTAEKLTATGPWYDACVARPVGKREIEKSEGAQKSLEKEWKKLRDVHCWDETKVAEWGEIAAKAKREGRKVHMGRIFEICVEKGSELPSGHPDRKFKGRVVFQG
jgi:hypothetical protein